jgi:hypothetical protein
VDRSQPIRTNHGAKLLVAGFLHIIETAQEVLGIGNPKIVDTVSEAAFLEFFFTVTLNFGTGNYNTEIVDTDVYNNTY